MKNLLSLLLAALTAVSVHADVSLPKIFSDHMVLQREATIPVWGWADAGEKITVSFNGATASTKADKTGRWTISLKAMSHGGPYEMKVSGKKNTITFKNVLIGDVWIGSGQSNMEWTIKNSNDPDKEIAEANYPKIRLFTVTKAMSYQAEKDLAGGQWLECSSGTIGDFSAVAYFFGRKLYKELDVPIGLVNSSWGGTNIQTWMSWDVMSKKDQYKTTDIMKLQAKSKDDGEKRQKYAEAMKNEKGMNEKWFDPSSNISGWKKIKLPGAWESTEIGNADGYVWFKREFELTEQPNATTTAVLSLGPIDDQDHTYLNGIQIGTMNTWNEPRNYTVKSEVLKQGKNTIVVRVLDTGGGGGIYGKPENLFVQIAEKKIPLTGDWDYKTSVLNTDFGIQNTGPNSFPSQLYNAMIHPIIPYAIKGVIWYQGESNTWEAYRYRELFPEMIQDWRSKWNSEFAFLWVQLANFMAADSIPKESDWAELREAQTMTLSLPKTGQAVTIDIGEANDIHPRNKQDVGLRLAFAALKSIYGKDVVHSGPTFKFMEVSNDKVVLSFDNTGGGLQIKDKYGYVKGFVVAGEDKKFYWANGWREGDKIVVGSPMVKKPVAVRYAWGNNPDDANIYNQEGLPAVPFRTDKWPGVSQGQK
jgi:sialate O-acetylesterase